MLIGKPSHSCNASSELEMSGRWLNQRNLPALDQHKEDIGCIGRLDGAL